MQERLSVDESLDSRMKSHAGQVDQLHQTTMTSPTPLPGGPAPASPTDSVSRSGSCHALRASLPVIRSPNHSSACSLGIYEHEQCNVITALTNILDVCRRTYVFLLSFLALIQPVSDIGIAKQASA